jgi:hypothetical protein
MSWRAVSVSILSAGALVLAALSGCTNETVEMMQGIADRACQCRDNACADKVQQEFYDFAQANAKARGSQSDHEEVKGEHDRMRDCLTRVRSAAGVQSSPEGGGAATGTGEGAAPAAGQKGEGAAPAAGQKGGEQ